VQVFQGTVIGRRGGGTNETFSVRKVSQGVGVERVFPLHSPNIEKIERVRVGAVRRAKLYYLRELTGKSARIKEVYSEGPSADEVAAEQAAAQGEVAGETMDDAAIEESNTEALESSEVEAAKGPVEKK
jgi:hypothetical protein